MHGLLNDTQGNPSTMRVAALTTVATGCLILVGAALDIRTCGQFADDALVLVGLGLIGKTIQRAAEGRKKE